jgi:hypothetical protein
MPYVQSLQDKLSQALAPVNRKVSDINVGLFGTRVNLLRISKAIDTFTGKKHNIFGDYEQQWGSTVLSNVVIKYPFDKVELFHKETNGTFQGTGIDLMEFLPITLDLQFYGEFSEDPIVMKEGDLLVDVLFDENNNGMPMVMELKRLYGGFYGKDIVSKKAEMTLSRGALATDIQNEIDIYIQQVTDERKNPGTGAGPGGGGGIVLGPGGEVVGPGNSRPC